MLSDINLSFERLSPSMRQVGYVLLTRAPVASFGLQANQTDAPRLACVKPVASVHPEPGSNSSLLKLFYIFAQNLVFYCSPRRYVSYFYTSLVLLVDM